MLTQIEFYDKDVIKNILGILTLKPDKAVFIYDDEIKDLNRFIGLEKCLKRHLPNIIFEKYPVYIFSVSKIYNCTKNIIDENEDTVVDLTGGSELMTIAGCEAGIDTRSKIVYSDIIGGRVVNIANEKDCIPAAKLSLEDYVDCIGASFMGNSHSGPDESQFDNILTMCRFLFRNIKEWRHTCSYLQQVMADSDKNDLFFRAPTKIKIKNGRYEQPNARLMEKFEQLGFIRDLYISPGHMVFEFSNALDKAYMISYGIWLELFVYINAVKSGLFTDVRLGTMIDWDIYNARSVPGNEIDVIFTDKSMPVFVSCKLTEATTAALNELLIEKKRIGGWFSKAIIVTFSDEKAYETGTYKRAKELGIEMLDRKDILSDNFQQKLINAVQGHDLVSLKWKKF
ncbi:MAG: DUF1887 family CARF protein [Clostridia bacterium]|jgi:hypothetical protein|nr:DUF1887 family CARF protein [Clostridia bacterium]MCI2000954.1 DUF1887 family CARF protein [Clostridia bacterium]MCI2015738.1 DUF1887 family CARF protein [Clostridia bacterium]